MSFKGSLQTIALPEVLQFLADTHKSGELSVSSPGREGGRLWLDDGRLSGHRVGSSKDTADAIFELLRLSDGEFDFVGGAERPEEARATDGEGVAVGPEVEQAQARLEEWTRIAEVVPSLRHLVDLVGETSHELVTLSPAQWALVVGIGEGRTVGRLLSERDLSEYDGCRAISELVQASLVAVHEPAEEPVAEEPVAEEAPEPVFAPEPVLALVPEPVGPEGGVLALEDEDSVMESPVADEDVAPAVIVPIPSFNNEPAPWNPEEVTPAAGFHGSAFRHDETDPALVVPVADDAVNDRWAALKAVADSVELDELGDHDDDNGGGAEIHTLRPMPVPDQVTEGVAAVDDAETAPTAGRVALAALLAEVTALPADDGEAGLDDYEAFHSSVSEAPVGYEAFPSAEAESPVDGLADRGPWTAHELAAFDGWHDGPGTAEDLAPAAEVEEEEDHRPVEEPMNRGLLLKFLSSVRN